MTYDTPQIHEVGTAEDVIRGPVGTGSDMPELFPPDLLVEDFYE